MSYAEKAFHSFRCLLWRNPWKRGRHILKRLSKKLADKWRRPYSQTVSFVKTRFAISLVRAKNQCIRGSRIPTGRISHRVDWEDVAGLALHPGIELKSWVDCQFTKIFSFRFKKISFFKKHARKCSSGSLLGLFICPDKRNLEAAPKRSLHNLQGIN